ncbi:hypothetical protein [Geodermatophilus dictyosporus]|uniref:hypothetical protein n=1 Tax=Geodermatophilus dictyosporus TaxID=1523247 RepID=UPI0010AA22E7|nr:hypothetical protein [Geodermatophilus dictyosporus]
MAIRVLGTVFVLVALLGVLAAGTPLLLVTVLLGGAAGAGLAQLVHWALEPGGRAPLQSRLTAATATGLFFPFISGTEALGPGGSSLSVVVILLTTLCGLHWIAQVSRETLPTGVPARASPCPDPSSLQPLLRRLPLDELLDEWRCSSAGLHVDGHAAVRVRELLLEEIRRRDPEGFRRWLGEGPGEDPRPYVRDAGPALPTAERPDEPTSGR